MPAAAQPGLVEWLLNALWLLLTVAAAWAAHRTGTPRSRRSERAIAIIAVACAATVLFPAISVSDDFYDQQWAIEDTCLKVKKPDQVTACPGAPHTTITALRFAHLQEPIRHDVGVAADDEDVRVPSRYVLPSATRAPPDGR
jgi:hypothetical protein